MKRSFKTGYGRLLAGALVLAVTLVATVGVARSPEDAARVAAVVQPATDFSVPETYEERPGGATTHFKAMNRDAFSHPSANMAFEREMDFKIGNAMFRKMWVASPSSTKSSDGLGPLFNARSCQRCHLKDGRGHPPVGNHPDDDAVSMFLRLSIPPQTEAQKQAITEHRINLVPEPNYGEQLQDFAVTGMKAEGRMHIEYEDVPIELADGTVVNLRKPTYTVTDLAYGPLHPDVMISPRVTPQMIGLGLLDAIPEEELVAFADPDDEDGDGISGRPNWVWDAQMGEVATGRYGWKAGNPTVAQQSAGAFAGDIGIANPMVAKLAGECTEKQKDCMAAPHGGDDDGFEINAEMFRQVVFYASNLSVPARRDVDDPDVLAGKKLFYEANCIGCHRPKWVTERREDMPEQSFQLIWPYTDLLLHDMGEGLADGRPEGVATGREWRTPPLWGIGLTETVNGHTNFLHDGRARNLLEAILWHGGEAEAAKRRVMRMSKAEREQLITFIDSL